jgi:hypothetical protein
MKRYAHVLKALFKQYAGTMYTSRDRARTFDSAAHRAEEIVEAAFLKLLKDHGITPNMLSKA